MAQPQALRRQNRRQIMELLLAHGTLTRPQLAERSGLSKVTVNAIVQQLLEHRMVTLLGGSSQGSGRVPHCVSLHPQLGGVMGLDVQRGRVLYQRQALGGQGRQDGEWRGQPDLNGQLKKLMQASVGTSTVVLGIPAPVDSAGHPVEPNALPELDPAGLRAALHPLGISLTFENDANLAALAAARHYPECGHLAVLLERESGTGLGLILHGRLYRGALGRAGELGRTPWPHAAGSEVLEHLPEGQRREATAYTLAGLAHTLDLGRVVIGACPHVGHDLARRTAALLPAGITLSVEGKCAELVRDGAAILALGLGREALRQRLEHLTGDTMGMRGEGHVA